jgi:hypothetical protein
VYSTAEFDPSVTRLAVGFDGHDIQKLSSELDKVHALGQKAEFESTQEWKDRLNAVEAQSTIGPLTRKSIYAFLIERNAPLIDMDDAFARAYGTTMDLEEAFGALKSGLDELTAASKLSRRDAAQLIEGYGADEIEQVRRNGRALRAEAVVLENRSKASDPVAQQKSQHAVTVAAGEPLDSPGNPLQIVYDADRASFDVTVQADLPVYPGGSTLRSSTGRASHRTYTGSNAYGALMKVDQYNFKEFKLLIANVATVPFVANLVPKRLHFEIPMPAEKAREVKPQIQAIAICKLLAPYTTSVAVHREATRDSPIELNIDRKYIIVDLLDVLVYNRDSGEVYARLIRADKGRP